MTDYERGYLDAIAEVRALDAAKWADRVDPLRQAHWPSKCRHGLAFEHCFDDGSLAPTDAPAPSEPDPGEPHPCRKAPAEPSVLDEQFIHAIGNYKIGYRASIQWDCEHRHPTTVEAYNCARERLRAESFHHIDWCTSTGEYGALDCDCPETPREERLISKLYELIEIHRPKPENPRYAVGVVGHNIIIDCGTHEEAMRLVERVRIIEE